MKKKSCPAALTPWFTAGKFTAAALFAILLAGCSAKSSGPSATGKGSTLVVPEIKVVDFQLVPCDHIWQADDGKTTGNSLYWLRAMDCAVRLSPADARAEARRWPDDNWQSAFKQGVLMANGNVTPVERREYLQRLDTFSQSYPSSVRVLIQLWRDDQMGLLQLSEERTRYHHLQQASDAELDALRQQQLSLNKELNVTRRKLETLTDIERQLSSRRSPDTSDSSHSDKSGGAGNSSPGNNTDGSQP
ncbi:two-component system QseEF-associated lipoprotein QseG [Pantoea sp. BAV 3049]|uniref:two-component system QseEF-associated lipoprotein QseG n=1 Tax=Pantoea sp. BAV 3049 TaxID=2654188 RepID=UPI00131C4F81|nr:two-component system QseEF-associated lipoprotein QseG [Pantoea sp. BAV 3049]